MSEIKKFKDFSLDQFSVKGPGLGTALDDKYGEWLVAPVALVRGGSLINAANYKSGVTSLKARGYKFFEYSANNWQAGWVTLCLAPLSKESQELLEEFAYCIEAYGVMDSALYSTMQCDVIVNHWNNSSLIQLMEDCDRADLSMFLGREKNLPKNMLNYYMQQEDFQ